MTAAVRFHHQGLSDYKALVREYASIRPELGRRFMSVFGQQARLVAEWPALGHRAIKHYRFFLLGRFPFKVFYRRDAHGIVVMTICHSKRHSRVWKGILKNA